jgi:hypothetical protein
MAAGEMRTGADRQRFPRALFGIGADGVAVDARRQLFGRARSEPDEVEREAVGEQFEPCQAMFGRCGRPGIRIAGRIEADGKPGLVFSKLANRLGTRAAARREQQRNSRSRGPRADLPRLRNRSIPLKARRFVEPNEV